MNAYSATTSTGSLRVLLISKDDADAVFFGKIFEHPECRRFELLRADSLSEAFVLLDISRFHAVLFVASERHHSLERVRKYKPAVPVLAVMVDGTTDPQSKMLTEKSHGYIAKNNLTPELLAYAICNSIQTHALQQELDEARRRENQEKHLRLLERLSGAPQVAVTARRSGKERIRDVFPDRFNDISRRYRELLDAALNQIFRDASRGISDGLRAISEELGALHAAPGDLLDIHSESLRIKSCGQTLVKAREYAEEGRLVLIEAMGYMASYYRDYGSYTASIINSISPETYRAPKPAASRLQAVLA